MDPDFTKNSDRDTPFRPQAENNIAPWLIATVFVAGLLYLGYKISDWSKPTPSPNTPPIAGLNPKAQPLATPPQAPTQTPPSTSDARIVTKCVVNGVPSYSDSACTKAR